MLRLGLVFASMLVCGSAAAQICCRANTEIWVLMYSGCDCQVSVGDMDTKQQCEQLKHEIEPQTAAWTELTCAKKYVLREKV